VSDELLQAIIANPDDDQLRLVHADALTQAGHPQGEYIACVLGGHHERAASILEANRRLFTEPLRAGKLDEHAFGFARGMVERVRMTTDQLALLEGICARAPVRALQLDGGGRVGAWPASLARVTRLEAFLVADEALAGLPGGSLAGLRECVLVGPPSRAAVLGLAGAAPGLRALRVGEVTLDAETVLALGRLPLEELMAPRLTDDALGAIGRATSLRALKLTRAGELDARQLERWDGPARLERLDVSTCTIGLDGARALVAAPMVRDIVELRLDATRLGDRGVAILAGAGLARLRRLSLGWNGLKRPTALVDSPAFASLTHLSLGPDLDDRTSNEIELPVAKAIRARYGSALRDF
jgi:uncharacterized protein (TIGR02996 family)